MKKMILVATLAALLTTNVQANTVGLYLGGQIWESEASGAFGEKNTLIDFNLKKEQQSNYFFAIEHPFSLLPNVRISSTSLDTVGKTNLTQELNFDDETFLIDDNVDASFNVSYVDYTLYYELFDNGLFSFDFGLTARDFNGAVTITGTKTIVTTTGKIKTDETVPMLYVATNISLPLTGLSVFTQSNFLSIDNHSLYDYQVGLNYELVDSRKVDFSLTLGYRAVKMEFENIDNLYTDLEFKGAFAGMIVHF